MSEYPKMEQADKGRWFVRVTSRTTIGPDKSHRKVVEQFRAKYGEDAVLLSDYAGTD